MMLCAPSSVRFVAANRAWPVRAPPGVPVAGHLQLTGLPLTGEPPWPSRLSVEGSAQSAEQDRKRLKFARPKRQAPPKVGRRCQATRMLVLCVV